MFDMGATCHAVDRCGGIVAVLLLVSLITSVAAPVQVYRTGQTVSYRAGDDGDLQKGAPLPVPRFLDEGDGTVIDKATGLQWVRDAFVFGGRTNWTEALYFCNDLILAGYDDWRMPNVLELQSLIDYSQAGPSMLFHPHPFRNVSGIRNYWTSSVRGQFNYWFRVSLYYGWVTHNNGISDMNYVWPVRTPEPDATPAQTNVTITSFEGGNIVWTNVDTNLNYSLEWLSELQGSNAWRRSYDSLTDIHSTASTISAEIPFFYRVVGHMPYPQPSTVRRTGQGPWASVRG